MRVLVVEDEKDIQFLLKMALEANGRHEVSVADNGLRGIELASQEQPDVILLDVMMPLLDGFETIRRLRADDTTRQIPVIFLTAKAQSKEIEQGLALGAIGYLTKPFYAMTLNEEIEALLSRAE
ncbi:response regulator [Candidatus Poribacteria bacterium]|nr:response regulator [Candidatus Poribacteria bacterium]